MSNMMLILLDEGSILITNIEYTNCFVIGKLFMVTYTTN